MARRPGGSFETDGVLNLDPHEALDGFLKLLAADRSHQTAAQLEHGKFGALMRSRGRGVFVSAIAPETKPAREEGSSPVSSDPLAQIQTLPTERRRSYLLSLIRDLLRAMLTAPDAALPGDRGFFELGLDSLMAVEFRNRLQAIFQAPFPPTLLLEHPNPASLTTYILSRFADSSTPEEPPPKLESDEIPGVLEEAARMSDGEILNALRSR